LFTNTRPICPQAETRKINPATPSLARRAAPSPDSGTVVATAWYRREDQVLAVVAGDRDTLYTTIHDHWARDFGTIIALRVEVDDHGHDVSWLEERLNPSPFLPLRHAEALLAWAG